MPEVFANKVLLTLTGHVQRIGIVSLPLKKQLVALERVIFALSVYCADWERNQQAVLAHLEAVAKAGEDVLQPPVPEKRATTQQRERERACTRKAANGYADQALRADLPSWARRKCMPPYKTKPALRCYLSGYCTRQIIRIPQTSSLAICLTGNDRKQLLLKQHLNQ